MLTRSKVIVPPDGRTDGQTDRQTDRQSKIIMGLNAHNKPKGEWGRGRGEADGFQEGNGSGSVA